MLAHALLLAVAIGSLPREPVEDSLRRALSNDNAPFCANPDYAPRRPNEDLCALARAEGQRCPNLLRACDAKEPIRTESKFDWSALRGLADVLFWGVVALLIVLIVVAIARPLMQAIESRRKRERPRKKEVAEVPTAVALVARETDTSRLLTMAEELAAAGRFEEAIAAGYAALVRALGEAGLITVDSNRTNGDHLRDLGAKRELQRSVREVFRGTEMVQFGRRPATRDLFNFVFERLAPIVRHGLTLCLFVVAAHALTACTGQFEDGEEASKGFGVLTSLLTDGGTKVRRRLSDRDRVGDDVAGILVVGSEEEEASQHFLDWAEEGGNLFVTRLDPLTLGAGRLKFADASCSEKLELDSSYQPRGLRLFVPRPRCMEVVPTPDKSNKKEPTQIVARSGRLAYVATRGYGKGSITFFADDRLLRNASLSVGDNAYFAVSLLNQPGRVLELVGPWTGPGASSPFAAVRHAGLVPIILALLGLALVAAWHHGAAFGKRRDPVTEPRRAFADHVRALGGSYARAHATRFALGAYGAWAVDRLRERLSSGQAVGLIDLSGIAARRAGLTQAQVVTMLAEAREAQEDGHGRAPSDLAKLEDLERLVSKAGGFGERRTS